MAARPGIDGEENIPHNDHRDEDHEIRTRAREDWQEAGPTAQRGREAASTRPVQIGRCQEFIEAARRNEHQARGRLKCHSQKAKIETKNAADQS